MIVRSAEVANQQAHTLRGHDTQIQFIKKLAYQRKKKEVHGGGKPKDSSRKTQAPKEKPHTYDDSCWGCGAVTQHPKTECPAASAKCAQCNRTGHWTRLCKSKETATDNQRQPPSLQTIGFIQTPSISAVSADDMVAVTILTQNKPDVAVNFLPVKGTEIDAIQSALFNRLFPDINLDSAAPPRLANDMPITNDG